MGAMRDLTDSGMGLEIQGMVIFLQMIPDGRHSDGTVGAPPTHASRGRNSDRVVFRRICRNGRDTPHPFLPIASGRISAALASAMRASATQASLVRSSGPTCQSSRTCYSVVCFV